MSDIREIQIAEQDARKLAEKLATVKGGGTFDVTTEDGQMQLRFVVRESRPLSPTPNSENPQSKA
jgi:hypothetical protein